MTMHLAKGYSSLSTRKPKIKYTKSNMEKWAAELLVENKKRKQQHESRLSLDEYIDMRHGIVPKPQRKFEVYKPARSYAQMRAQETKKYPSVTSNAAIVCEKPERKEYTGTLVKGIATMHKSNAVPIIDDEQARDISRMRRG